MFRICHVFLSVHCSLVLACLERADLLALWFVTFYCDFVTFHVVSWVRCGAGLYRFLIFALILIVTASVLWLFLKVQCVGVHCVIV